MYIYIYICIHTLIPFRAFLAGPCFGFWTRFFLLFWALTTSVHTLHMPKPVLAAAHSTERISRRLFQRSKGPGYICIYIYGLSCNSATSCCFFKLSISYLNSQSSNLFVRPWPCVSYFVTPWCHAELSFCPGHTTMRAMTASLGGC